MLEGINADDDDLGATFGAGAGPFALDGGSAVHHVLLMDPLRLSSAIVELLGNTKELERLTAEALSPADFQGLGYSSHSQDRSALSSSHRSLTQ